MANYGAPTQGYLDAKQVMFSGALTQTIENNIQAICYLNHYYWLCPDPKNAFKSEPCKNQYNAGAFSDAQVRWLSEEQYKEFSEPEW